MNLTWSSHSIQLEGCGGPQFQLLLRSSSSPGNNNDNDRIRQLLSESGLTTFRRAFSPRQIKRCTELQICANRDDWHELRDDTWQGACAAIGGHRRTLESVGFSTTFCRRGYEDTKLRRLFPHTPNVKEVTVQDGLYGYVDTFPIMAKGLPQLQNLILKDVSYGKAPLDRRWCESLADLVRKLPNLRSIQLWGATFESRQDWDDVIVDAIKDNLSVEQVDLHRLRTLQDRITDFSMEAIEHPVFQEKRAVVKYLEEKGYVGGNKKENTQDRDGGGCGFRRRPYTLSERLEAFLHVRSQGLCGIEKARQVSAASFAKVVSTVSDQMDCCFQLLRYEADPGLWTTMMSTTLT